MCLGKIDDVFLTHNALQSQPVCGYGEEDDGDAREGGVEDDHEHDGDGDDDDDDENGDDAPLRVFHLISTPVNMPMRWRWLFIIYCRRPHYYSEMHSKRDE